MWLVEEHHQLPLFIPVMLGAGIALWFGLGGADRWLAAIAACLAAAFCGLLLSGLLRRVVAAGALLVAAGVALAWWHAASAAAPVLEDTRFGIPISGVVLEIEEQQARGRTRLLISPRSMLPAEMTVRVSIRGELPDIAPGALVRMRATLNPPPGPSVPGGYHFARRAWFEGIGATGYALGEPELLAKAPDSSGFSAWLQDLRRNLTRRLQEGVGGREGRGRSSAGNGRSRRHPARGHRGDARQRPCAFDRDFRAAHCRGGWRNAVADAPAPRALDLVRATL